MSSAEAYPPRCQLVGSTILPADAGSPEEICRVIDAEARSLAPGVSYSIEVRVLSPSSLAARVRMGTGQTLPEQKLAVNDRNLNRTSIKDFATVIGVQIAQASQK